MSGAASGEPGKPPREPRSALRILPWLLVPLVLIPLVWAIVRTTGKAAVAVDSTVTEPMSMDSVPVYAPDSAAPAPARHPHATAPHHASADSARHKDGLLKKVGREIEKAGVEPVTPDGQGAMGGDGPTGKGRGVDTVTPIAPPAAAGAMGGDGPPGKR